MKVITLEIPGLTQAADTSGQRHHYAEMVAFRIFSSIEAGHLINDSMLSIFCRDTLVISVKEDLNLEVLESDFSGLLESGLLEEVDQDWSNMDKEEYFYGSGGIGFPVTHPTAMWVIGQEMSYWDKVSFLERVIARAGYKDISPHPGEELYPIT